MACDYEHLVPEFFLENPSLPFLVIDAGIEIDGHRLGLGDKGDKSVKYLSKLLDNLTQGENPRAKLPENNSILGYAIFGRKIFGAFKGKKQIDEQVLIQTNLVSKDLMGSKNLDEEKQEDLSKFCFDLSREIIEYQIKRNKRKGLGCF